MRGDADIILYGFDLLGLAVFLSKNERRKVIFLAGSAIGSILVTAFNPSQFAQDQPGSLAMRLVSPRLSC